MADSKFFSKIDPIADIIAKELQPFKNEFWVMLIKLFCTVLDITFDVSILLHEGMTPQKT